MLQSKTIIKVAGIMPRLRLGNKTDKGVEGTGPHRVKFITDKEAKGTDPITGKERDEVAYLVEENGEKKSYRVKKFNAKGEINYLVIRLADVKEGEEVIMEMKRKGIKNYIDVSPVKEGHEVEVEDEDDLEIPIIDQDEDIKDTDNPLLSVESEV